MEECVADAGANFCSKWTSIDDGCGHTIRVHTLVKESNGPPSLSLTPLFIIHGTATNSPVFIPFMKSVPANQAVYCIDLPSYGLSDNCSFDLGKASLNVVYESYNQIILQLINFYLGNDAKVCLLAHSMGGVLTCQFMGKHHERVTHAFLCNSAGLLPVMSPYGMFWSWLIYFAFPERLFKTWIAPHLCYGVLLFFSTWNVHARFDAQYLFNPYGEGYKLLARHMHIEYTKKHSLESFWYPCCTEQLLHACKKKVDVCLIYGHKDTLISSLHGQVLNKFSEGHISYHILEDAGHSPMNTKPHVVAGIISKAVSTKMDMAKRGEFIKTPKFSYEPHKDNGIMKQGKMTFSINRTKSHLDTANGENVDAKGDANNVPAISI
jgi:pimeloyl-ACP methyl ester carboxylesterase